MLWLAELRLFCIRTWQVQTQSGDRENGKKNFICVTKTWLNFNSPVRSVWGDYARLDLILTLRVLEAGILLNWRGDAANMIPTTRNIFDPKHDVSWKKNAAEWRGDNDGRFGDSVVSRNAQPRELNTQSRRSKLQIESCIVIPEWSSLPLSCRTHRFFVLIPSLQSVIGNAFWLLFFLPSSLFDTAICCYCCFGNQLKWPAQNKSEKRCELLKIDRKGEKL